MYRRKWMLLGGLTLITMVSACDTTRPTEPPDAPVAFSHNGEDDRIDYTIVREVRKLAAERGIVALPARQHIRESLVRLGQALVFDPILSGNRDISCMSCHPPAFATGDGKSLSVGQGGSGVGPTRSHPQGIFIPRNAPSLFNLSALRRLFWDGRVEVDSRGRFHTPAGVHLTREMTRVFEFGAISALPLFPVTNREEMRAFSGNELAAIPDEDFTGIWKALMARLGRIPEYREMFEDAYRGTPFARMTFAHASNAMAAFFVDELSFNNSPWDRFLAGRDNALTARQLAGARTFLTLRCSICHSGATFSDQEFHNVAVAQVGPGKGNGPDGRDDFGRMNVSSDAADRYRFRSTPLRNVELTGPYGHDGTFLTLREFIEHYSESDLKLQAFNANHLEPLLRGTLVDNKLAILATRDTLLNGVVFGSDILNQLMDYMSALTDDDARNLRRLVPHRVPSRLPVDR